MTHLDLAALCEFKINQFRTSASDKIRKNAPASFSGYLKTCASALHLTKLNFLTAFNLQKKPLKPFKIIFNYQLKIIIDSINGKVNYENSHSYDFIYKILR